jgi:hypothetical protein
VWPEGRRVSFHDVVFTDDGPTGLPPDVAADAPREPPKPGEVEVYAVEYRLLAGQRRQKGNRAMSAVRKPARGVEILYATADGSWGVHRRFWREAVERDFRASLGVPPAELEPLAEGRRRRVRDVLQVAHHDHLPERAPTQSDRWTGFVRASALATDGGHPDGPAPTKAGEESQRTVAADLESDTSPSLERDREEGGGQ